MSKNQDPAPAGSPPDDPRPKPRYGELAPEGWTWNPPKEPAKPPESDAVRAQDPQGRPAGLSTSHPSPLRSAGVPAWDRPVTFGLLILGLLGVFFTISVLAAVPDALQLLYTQQDLGTYHAAGSVAGLIITGGICQVVTWLATALASILLLLRNRRAFYVPLIGGVISFVVIFVFLAIVMTTDPTLIDFYSRP